MHRSLPDLTLRSSIISESQEDGVVGKFGQSCEKTELEASSVERLLSCKTSDNLQSIYNTQYIMYYTLVLHHMFTILYLL